MVLKISDLRKQYGLDPTFETEEEALAYEEERRADYEERVAAKVQELKNLYNSNKEKYSKFKNFKEDDWVSYAKVCLQTNNAINTKFTFNSFPSVSNNPEVAKWAQFSYEEILQMESNGVLIPKEVLAWAHSMQDSDVTAYEINEDPEAAEETEETGTNSENSELKELQKKTQTLSNKSENTQVQINQNFEAFKEVAEKAEQIKQEQETTKKDSLKQIEELTKEWEEISAKIKKGDKLTESEQKRYKELGSMLNGKDGELVTDIQASSDDLQTLINSMDGLNNELTTSIELGDDTIEAAKQLALYEKGYTRKNTGTKDVIDITTGDIRNALQGTQGKDIAEEALNIGSNLIEFSNTLSTQLMMNQYASLYDFAEIFTQTSTETLTNTKEVLGDDFNKTTEELNEQVDALPDMTNAENDQARLEEKGVGIIGQALYFTGKSKSETLKSIVSMVALALIQRQAEKETEKSQDLTDVVVEKMTSKKEEADKLTEKKEKAEEKKEQSQNALENIENGDNAKAEEAQKAAQETDEDEFTEEDQQKLDKLNSQLERTGNFGQQKLYQSLSKVDTYNQTINAKKLDGANAIDYGTVTQEVGNSLMDQVSPSIFMIFLYAIAGMAIAAGKAAEGIGKENNELFEETNNTTESGKASIGANQLSIQETTAVEAINLVSTAQGENNSAQAETTDDTNAAAQTSDAAENTTSTDTNVGSADVNNNESVAEDTTETISNIPTTESATPKDTTELASSTQNTTDEATSQINGTSEQNNTNETSKSTNSNGGSKSKSEEAEDMSPEEATSQGKTQAKEADKVDDQVKSAKSEAKTAQKESKSVNKDSEKTEKQLEQEMKNLDKLNEKDTKDIEKLAKDSEKAQQEQLALAAEFETLNAQNEEIIANQQAKQNQTPAPAAAPANAQQQGGLLSPKPQMISSTDSSAQTTLDANNTRIQGIASRFTTLSAKITTNRTKITQKSSSINQRTRKFEKLAQQRIKIQKAAQKKEQEKQRRMEVLTATINVANTAFSIVSSVGTIIGIVGKIMITSGTTMATTGKALIIAGTPLLSNPFTAIAGAAMVATGTALEISGEAITTSGGVLEGTGETLNTIGLVGVAACGVAKAGVMAANGDIKGALTSLGTTIISIATSFIPGAGAGAQAGISTAQAALQITSASANIVSSTANMAASAQTLAGKEQSGWLNTVSQVAGLVSTATSVGSGFAGGKDAAGNNTPSAFKQASTFGKVMQVTQAAGTALTTTAQASTLIKQANGKESGEFENILNTVGFSLSTAASLGQIGEKISGAIKNKKEVSNDDNVDSTDKKDKNNKNKKVEKKDKDKIEKTDKAEEKTKEDDKAADEITAQPADANASDTVGSENAKTETEQKTEEIVKSIDETETKVDPKTKQDLENAQTTETTDELNIEDKLTPQQNKIVRKFIAKDQGLKIGKPQVIGENSFEITSDGQYLVNGKKVNMANFLVEIQAAKGTNTPVTEATDSVVETQDSNDASSENDGNKPQQTISTNPENTPDSETPSSAEENSDLTAVDEIVTELDENNETANLEQTGTEIEEAASQDSPEAVSDNQNPEESDKLEKPDGAQEILDEEMDRALSVDKGEIKTREPEKTDAQRKFERQQKMDKAVEIGSTILEAGSQGLQAYSAIQNLMASPEQEEQRNVLHLSNMKKGKSLIRKIKKRRAALYGYATK